MRSSASHRVGFTLIEIMITIAISGILTAIIFTGLRNEQQRSAAKDAADRLQVELIGLQNKIQSAIALPGKYCHRGGGSYAGEGNTCTVDADCLVAGVQGRCIEGPPARYGLTIATNAESYTLFADMPQGIVGPNGQYSNGTNDRVIAASKSLGTNVRVVYIRVNNQQVTSADITFGGNEGKMSITKVGGMGSCSPTTVPCSFARIVVQHQTTGVCYRIDMTTTTGVVTKREYSPSCI